MSLRAVAVVGLVVGCGGRQSSVDTATVCVFAEEQDTGASATVGGAVDLEPGEPLRLQASASFGCHTTDHFVDCSITAGAAGELVVTTETRWTRNEPLSMNCEAIIRSASGFCETAPLAEGAYLLRYGGREIPFDVPGTVEGCLTGQISRDG